MKHDNQFWRYTDSIGGFNTFNSSMLNKKYIQFKHENETWLRTLDYFRQENIYLKNRLAQIAKTNINNSFLVELEAYQNRFVEKDTIVAILRYDITLQNELILKCTATDDDDNCVKKILLNQNKLRDDMQQMEKEFNKLKFDFNNYLAEAIQ